jgi:hypothetical protein
MAGKIGSRPAQRAPRRRVRVTATLLVLFVAADAPAGAQGIAVDALPDLIVDESNVPLDAAGEPQLDAVPGVRARQALPAEIEQRLLDLSAARAAVGAVSPSGALPALIAPLPDGGAAPARVDSGDRDPDRLRSAPPPPVR